MLSFGICSKIWMSLPQIFEGQTHVDGRSEPLYSATKHVSSRNDTVRACASDVRAGNSHGTCASAHLIEHVRKAQTNGICLCGNDARRGRAWLDGDRVLCCEVGLISAGTARMDPFFESGNDILLWRVVLLESWSRLSN